MRSPLVRSTVCPAALALLFLLSLHPCSAQGQPQLSEQSQISLITILPGDPVHTFAGHSAFRIHAPERDLDRLYNYGTFDFSDPLFIPKFTYGYLRYFLSVSPYRPTVRVYKQQGRPVIEQRLNLTPSQRTALYQFLRENAQPQNRYYQYDFFFDNCSTRIRDALKETLGENVDFSNAPAPNRSFRRLLDPYVASRPFLDLGFDLGLGLPADQKASAWEAMFLPGHLKEAFAHATVSANGTRRPLVAQTDTVQWVSDYGATTPAFDWPIALSGLFLILVLGWTSWQAKTQRSPSGRGDAFLFACVGFAGLVICYLWFISTYAVTDLNLNLGWAWPTHLVAAILLLRRPTSSGLRTYLGVTATATALFALGWPIWPQNFHLAVLPFILGVGVRAGWWSLLPQSRMQQAIPSTELSRSEQ
jgi:hypothetical protein